MKLKNTIVVVARVRRLLRLVASVLVDICKNGFLGVVTYLAGILAFSLSLSGAIILIRTLVRSETYTSPPEGTLSELVIGVAALAVSYGCAELAMWAAAMLDENRRAARRFLLRKCLPWFVSGVLFAVLVTFATATPL